MEDRNMDDSTSVLIVGGSLNGLTMAMLLARRRVPCLVLERHPQIQYRFRGISPRSMEIYRSAGIEAEIRARDPIDDRSASVGRMKNLADAEVSWQAMTRVPAIDRPPAKALDEALQAIGARYGARTTDLLAMQLEYPMESRGTVRERANASGQTAMTRSLR
jgi:putative polyketide hydroxylase